MPRFALGGDCDMSVASFCRNPDNSHRPWCWVRGHKQKVQKFCNIPQCEVKTGGYLIVILIFLYIKEQIQNIKKIMVSLLIPFIFFICICPTQIP